MRIVVWTFRLFLFFVLFAFSLNNLHTTAVHWFFGVQWHAPLVFIVLAAFAGGAALGILAMVPSWWRHRRVARRQESVVVAPSIPATPSSTMPLEAFPPRDGI